MDKYKHNEVVHNLSAPNIIVPEIIKLLNPNSVVDIGCGLGTFLSVFKQLGVNDVLGIDGPWVNKELLYNYIKPEEFLEKNLEKEIKLDKKYDLVVSLEVAEHISKDAADIFVQNLINSGTLILFSAAIPDQGGQNHINEQWQTYWEEKFAKYNYVVHDVIRPIFWDKNDVFWWYRQNMILVAPRDFTLPVVKAVPMRNIVHYELYKAKIWEIQEITRELQEITCGKKKTTFYIKVLVFSLFGYNFLKKIKPLLTRFLPQEK
jgi:SAM-dependent methyltransferase